MDDFFVIGCEDPGFRLCNALLSKPQFKGIVLPEGTTAHVKYSDTVLQQNVAAMKTVSLGSFLNYARKNPGVELVSFYNFSGGKWFLEKLQKSARNSFVIKDYYKFFVEHNMYLVFDPARDEREKILNGRREWAALRKQLTDDFSKHSIDCYLSAAETYDMSKMVPAYVDMEHKIANRLSRKLSFVPRPDEIYVDVGAWDGDTITLFVDVASTYKAIHAFEPAPHALSKLKKREFYLDNYTVHPQAVSNFTGEIEFLATNTPASRAGDVAASPNDNLIKVPCVKLDDAIDEATLIKVEVEGHETRVLEGAKNLIRKHKPDMAVYSYHFPLDPVRIVEQMDDIYHYKNIALRFHAPDLHMSIVYFSDGPAFE